jgi:hypothetical protein
MLAVLPSTRKEHAVISRAKRPLLSPACESLHAHATGGRIDCDNVRADVDGRHATGEAAVGLKFNRRVWIVVDVGRAVLFAATIYSRAIARGLHPELARGIRQMAAQGAKLD